MYSTSTVFVDPVVEDMNLARLVLPGYLGSRDQWLFAAVMPVLRKELEGITHSKLLARIGWPASASARSQEYNKFIARLYRAGVIVYGYPWRKKGDRDYSVIRLTSNYWLKETAMRQNSRGHFVVETVA